MPLAAHHSFTAFEIIYGPLSARRCIGAPRIAVSSSSTATTSFPRSRRRTSIARHSRVYLSSTTSAGRRQNRPERRVHPIRQLGFAS